jgi:hypothetical protein
VLDLDPTPSVEQAFDLFEASAEATRARSKALGDGS